MDEKESTETFFAHSQAEDEEFWLRRESAPSSSRLEEGGTKIEDTDEELINNS